MVAFVFHTELTLRIVTGFNQLSCRNHRIIRFDISGQEWGFQYSPYAYFNEHCIFLDSQHRPMAISRQSFERLLAIVEQFPGYFAGSNADCQSWAAPS